MLPLNDLSESSTEIIANVSPHYQSGGAPGVSMGVPLPGREVVIRLECLPMETAVYLL